MKSETVIAIALRASIAMMIGNGTLAAIGLVGLTAGHLLGGPSPEYRTVLALSTASRRPGVALSIASASVTDKRLMLTDLLLYLTVNAVVSIPFLIWRRRRSVPH
jgi:BASS family bile acid:Na+ symporter